MTDNIAELDRLAAPEPAHLDRVADDTGSRSCTAVTQRFNGRHVDTSAAAGCP